MHISKPSPRVCLVLYLIWPLKVKYELVVFTSRLHVVIVPDHLEQCKVKTVISGGTPKRKGKPLQTPVPLET